MSVQTDILQVSYRHGSNALRNVNLLAAYLRAPREEHLILNLFFSMISSKIKQSIRRRKRKRRGYRKTFESLLKQNGNRLRLLKKKKKRAIPNELAIQMTEFGGDSDNAYLDGS